MASAVPSLSIISPVYGCRNCLEDLVDRTREALRDHHGRLEFILVDDASPDSAWNRICELAANRPWIRGLRLSRNFGQHAAIAAGLEEAIGDIVVVMDCDLQDVPEEIPALVAAVLDGADVALARRAQRQDGLFKRFGSWAFYRILGWLTGISHDHTTANFGAYSRRVVDALRSMPESDRFFPLMVRWTGYRTTLVEVTHGRRTHGESAYSVRKLLSLALKIALSYSDKPLRMVVALGLTFAAISLLVVGLSIYRYLIGDTQVAGFTGIIASVWMMGSVILSSVGIIGLYLGRLFIDAKRRPNFIIAERVGAEDA